MTLQNTTTFTSSQTVVSRREISTLHRLTQYSICSALGMIGGATGTAIALGTAIIAQLVLFPTSTSLPGLIPLNLVAVFTGLMISWFLGWAGHRVIPTLASCGSAEQGLQVGWAGHRVIPTLASCGSAEQGLQVMLIFSGLISLLETTLYMYGAYV